VRKLLIAGLGIAGSALLYLIKRSSISDIQVTACDVRFSPWSHVVCGELVPEVTCLKGKVPHNVYRSLLESQNIIMSNTKILKTFNRMMIQIGEVELGFSFKFYMIDKGLLIRTLIERSEDRCEMMLGYSVYRFERLKDRVRVYVRSRDGARAQIDADVVAACDSFPSVFYTSDIWRLLSNYEYRYLTCISCTAEMFETYTDPYIVIDPKICPGGYAWVFPKAGDLANVGIGFLTDNLAYARTCLEEFLRRFNLKALSRPLSKTLPVDGVIVSRDSRVLYLGDAGGFVVPTNGAGINPAVASAVLALDSDLDVRRFNSRVLSTFGSYFARLVEIRKMLDKYLSDPLLFEKLKRDVARNRIVLPFFRRILRDLMLGHVPPMCRIFISCIDSLVASFKFSSIREVK